MAKRETQTGGRRETSGVIPGDFALSVGRPEKPAPRGWRWTKLTDMARLETGHTPSRKHPEYWGGDIPWVGIKDATSNHGGILHRTIQYTNDLGIANSSARILPKNTACLSRTASVGYVVMGCPMATSQDFVNWVCNEDKLNYNFLKYVLLSEQRSFLRFSSGTTHQTIYFPEVKAFHLCHPDLASQEKISGILTALDEKIELNRQIVDTIESIAQTLFKSWFVDFDPVIDNALDAGNPIPDELQNRAQARAALGEQRNPLTESIRQHFPNSFVLTEELGWIPDGWNLGSLEDMVILQRGFDLPKSNRTKGCYPLVVASGQDGTHNEFKVKGPGVTTGRSGKLGEVVFVHDNFWPLNTTLWIKEYKNSSPYHAFFLLKTLHLETYNSGSAVPTLNRNHIHNIPLYVPPKRVILAFDSLCVPLRKKQQSIMNENKTLVRARNTLLPKLLSGELSISDTEALIDEALSEA